MPQRRLRDRCLFATRVLTVLTLTCVTSTWAAAQAPPSDSTQATATGSPNFLFGRPHGSLGVRGGWIFTRGNSDLYDFVQRTLTIDHGDFNMPALEFDVGLSVTPRLDVRGGFEFNRVTVNSEYRDYVDNKLLPIEQSTELQQADISASLRYSLVEPGRAISRFAWVPRGVTPYVGAGGGMQRYRFAQHGDFVDFEDRSVFTSDFKSEGWAPSVHVFGGIDLQLYRALFMNLEARYLWSSADLQNDFVNFDPIDLAGFRLAAGINVRF
jgi:hypothetical protein